MILVAPIKTEKAINKIEYENTITFEVNNKASKKEIIVEFEKLFSVKVADVRTLITSKGRKHALIRLTKEFKADDVATKLKMIA